MNKVKYLVYFRQKLISILQRFLLLV